MFSVFGPYPRLFPEYFSPRLFIFSLFFWNGLCTVCIQIVINTKVPQPNLAYTAYPEMTNSFPHFNFLVLSHRRLQNRVEYCRDAENAFQTAPRTSIFCNPTPLFVFGDPEVLVESP